MSNPYQNYKPNMNASLQSYSIPIHPYIIPTPMRENPYYAPSRPYVFQGLPLPLQQHQQQLQQHQQFLTPSPRNLQYDDSYFQNPNSTHTSRSPIFHPINSPRSLSGSNSPTSCSPPIDFNSPRAEIVSEDDEDLPCAQCSLKVCVLCSRGRPTMLMKVPTWASIMKVVLYTLHIEHPDKQFFSLKSDVYGFMEAHWKRLCVDKKKSDNWRKQVQDMLSHSKNIFESGYETIGQNGYWRLKTIHDPWVIQELSSPRTSPDVHSKKRQIETASESDDDDTSSTSSLTNSDDIPISRKGRRTGISTSPRNRKGNVTPNSPTLQETVALRDEISAVVNQINDMKMNLSSSSHLNQNERDRKLRELEENMETLYKIENKLNSFEMKDNIKPKSTTNNTTVDYIDNNNSLDIYKSLMEENSIDVNNNNNNRNNQTQTTNNLNQQILNNNNNSNENEDWRKSLYYNFDQRNNNNNNNNNNNQSSYQYPIIVNKK